MRQKMLPIENIPRVALQIFWIVAGCAAILLLLLILNGNLFLPFWALVSIALLLVPAGSSAGLPIWLMLFPLVWLVGYPSTGRGPQLALIPAESTYPWWFNLGLACAALFWFVFHQHLFRLRLLDWDHKRSARSVRSLWRELRSILRASRVSVAMCLVWGSFMIYLIPAAQSFARSVMVSESAIFLLGPAIFLLEAAFAKLKTNGQIFLLLKLSSPHALYGLSFITVSTLLLHMLRAPWYLTSIPGTIVVILQIARFQLRGFEPDHRIDTGYANRGRAPNQHRSKSVRPMILTLLASFAVIALLGLIDSARWYLDTKQHIARIIADEESLDAEDFSGPALLAATVPRRIGWQFGIPTFPEMREIPKGDFRMIDGMSEVSGTHDSAFAVSATEITQDMYDYYRWHVQTLDQQSVNLTPDFSWGRGTRPALWMDWHQARQYTRWLSNVSGQQCRLPTEAEWEYAARAGTTTEYFWGDEVGQNNANCDGCGSPWDNEKTASVASFPPNAWGLYDMHGNVWEWVEDCWHDSYEGAPIDGSAWTTGGDCERRVVRGGSWLYGPDDVRSADRYRVSPDFQGYNLGFRVVCGLPFTGH